MLANCHSHEHYDFTTIYHDTSPMASRTPRFRYDPNFKCSRLNNVAYPCFVLLPQGLEFKYIYDSGIAEDAVGAPSTTTAFTLRPYCAATALLETLRRCYGDRTEFPPRSFQNAEGRRLFCACSKQTPSLGVLSRSMRSHGDPTTLPRRCLRSYYVVTAPARRFYNFKNVVGSPWDRHHIYIYI